MFESVKYQSCGKFVSRGKWIHPNRIINSHEIIFVIDGAVHINEDGHEYTLTKNDTLLLEPDLRHFGYQYSENTSFYWMHWVSDNFKPDKKLIHIESPYRLSLLIKPLLHYSVDNSYPESLDYLTRLIFAELYSANREPAESRLVESVSKWIKANRDTDLKVEAVAEHFGYNVDYLSRSFKKQCKLSLKRYIDQVKITHIKNLLLNTNLSLKEISDSCGFSDYKYFLKFFKYHEKVTPTEFCSIYFKTNINNK